MFAKTKQSPCHQGEKDAWRLDKTVESTLAPAWRWVAVLSARHSSRGEKSDWAPRAGGGRKKSYLAGQKPAKITSRSERLHSRAESTLTRSKPAKIPVPLAAELVIREQLTIVNRFALLFEWSKLEEKAGTSATAASRQKLGSGFGQRRGAAFHVRHDDDEEEDDDEDDKDEDDDGDDDEEDDGESITT